MPSSHPCVMPHAQKTNKLVQKPHRASHPVERNLPLSISKLIRTNKVPSVLQAIKIREIIKERKDLLPLAAIKLPSSEYALFKARIEDLEALFTSAPARTLIPEILSLIFQLCVSTQKGVPRPCGRDAPLLLGQVCKRWRQIALSTPQIWRSILVRIHISNASDYRLIDRYVHTLKTWLSRSGSLPIVCHIEYIPHVNWQMRLNPRHTTHDESGTGLVSALIPYITQWKDIHLQLPFGCLTPLLGIHDITAPVLRSLAIKHITFSIDEPWGRPGYDTTTVMPMGMKLPWGANMDTLLLDVPPAALRIIQPWSHLKEIVMTPSAPRKSSAKTFNNRLSLANALDMLRKLPDLERCTLALGSYEFRYGEIPPTTNPTALVMPKLHKLSLLADFVQGGAFLEVVKTPVLERLIVHKKCDQRTLRSFLLGLKYPLKELSLVRILSMTDEDLFNCLQLVSSLKHLHCTSPVGAQTLRALTPSRSVQRDEIPTNLCPHLEFIELRCWRPFDALVDMIDARYQTLGPASRLKVRLHLHCRPDYDEGVASNEAKLIERLQIWRDQGFDIQWQI